MSARTLRTRKRGRGSTLVGYSYLPLILRHDEIGFVWDVGIRVVGELIQSSVAGGGIWVGGSVGLTSISRVGMQFYRRA